MRRTKRDGSCIVGAHPHRQQLEPIARGDLRGEREVRRRRLFGRRDAHQPRNRQAVSVAAPDDEGIGVFRMNARLLRLGAGVEFDEQERITLLLCKKITKAFIKTCLFLAQLIAPF